LTCSTCPNKQRQDRFGPQSYGATAAPQGVELRHLRYFVAAADAGTLTGAGERIFIAQPTPPPWHASVVGMNCMRCGNLPLHRARKELDAHG
jgi:hypothetical protein